MANSAYQPNGEASNVCARRVKLQNNGCKRYCSTSHWIHTSWTDLVLFSNYVFEMQDSNLSFNKARPCHAIRH